MWIENRKGKQKKSIEKKPLFGYDKGQREKTVPGAAEN